jgi:hypothetical protein
LFDGNKLNENITNAFASPKYVVHSRLVVYDYERSIANPQDTFWRDDPLDMFHFINSESDYARHYLDSHYREYFLRKSEEWMSEHEFRWLIHSENHDEEIKVSIEKAIKAVVIGVDCSSVYEPCVKRLCNNLGIQMYKMRWLGGRPRADLVNDS